MCKQTVAFGLLWKKKIKKAEEKKTLISILETCWSVLEDKEDAGLLDWSWMTDTE